jgi:ATP-dependent protease HslVU (ClpYQ) ATPase subunit
MATLAVVALFFVLAATVQQVDGLRSATQSSSHAQRLQQIHMANDQLDTATTALSTSSDSELSSLIEQMPTAEKYALLLQSYKNRVFGGQGNKVEIVDKMGRLYYEMVQKAIKPEEEASEALLDAAAAARNVVFMSNAVRLIRLHGDLRAYGVAIGMLTTPAMKKLVWLEVSCRA